MKTYKNGNSFKNNVSEENQINLNKTKFLNLKITHTVFDSINVSLLILIFILSFISFNSQRKWTNIYKNLSKTRTINNNLIDYISKTEAFYINEFESSNSLKKTTPKDLIYLKRQNNYNNESLLKKKLKYIIYGLKESRYQKGY